MHATDRHIFSFFTQTVLPNPFSLIPSSPFTLVDADVWHRLSVVLRLEQGDDCIIFDGSTVVQITLSNGSAKKNVIRGTIVTAYKSHPLSPEIHLYQGLLRRDAFDSVIYTTSQMGITSVTPIISQKIQRDWGNEREITRVEKVMIAGCEQAKQFVAPTLISPKKIADLITLISSTKGFWIHLDPSGQKFIDLVTQVTHHTTTPFHVIIGPEGGFTTQEQEALKIAGVQKFALTPTVLRSIDAAVLILGTLRSLLY